MQAIPVYLYDNSITVLYSDVAIPNRGDSVYQRDLKVYKGVNNTVKLQVKNNDQKKVNMSSRDVQFNLVDRDNRVNYVTKTATNINASDGLFSVTLSENDLLDLNGQWYNYSITVINTNGTRDVSYVDDAFGAKGNIQVIDAVYPDFVESNELVLLNNSEYTAAVDAHSDLNKNAAIHTAQFYFTSAFTGTVTVQGSMEETLQSSNSEFFDVVTKDYTSQTTTDSINFTGIYAQIRFRVETTTGTFSKVLYRY